MPKPALLKTKAIGNFPDECVHWPCNLDAVGKPAMFLCFSLSTAAFAATTATHVSVVINAAADVKMALDAAICHWLKKALFHMLLSIVRRCFVERWLAECGRVCYNFL